MTRTLNDIIRPGQSIRDLTADQQAEISALFEGFQPTEEARRQPVPPAIALTVARLRRAEAERVRAEADAAATEAVRCARMAHWSWERIGRSLDTTGEAARLRYRDLVA